LHYRNTFLSRVKRTRKRDKTIQKKKRRENSREDKGRRRKASPTTALSSSSPVDFLPADNFIGTLELPSGQSVASPIKARVDDSGTSVCSLPTNMNSTDKLKVSSSSKIAVRITAYRSTSRTFGRVVQHVAVSYIFLNAMTRFLLDVMSRQIFICGFVRDIRQKLLNILFACPLFLKILSGYRERCISKNFRDIRFI